MTWSIEAGGTKEETLALLREKTFEHVSAADERAEAEHVRDQLTELADGLTFSDGKVSASGYQGGPIKVSTSFSK